MTRDDKSVGLALRVPTSSIYSLSVWKEGLYNAPVSLAYSRNSTVLVVEDDPSLRELFRTAFTSAGFVVVAVEDGLDALRRVEQQPPNAVVLDLALPRMDGRDVGRELRARPRTRNIPIVVVSGTDMADLNHADFACVLRKPIHPEAVVVAVERSLRQRGRPESAV